MKYSKTQLKDMTLEDKAKLCKCSKAHLTLLKELGEERAHKSLNVLLANDFEFEQLLAKLGFIDPNIQNMFKPQG
jgi:hypothetical protein